MNIKIKKLHPDAIIPKYMTTGAAGFDLYAVEDCIISPGEIAKLPLGLSFEIPEGFVLYICMRSGISIKTYLRQSNGIGVIDSDYRGEVSMLFDNNNPDNWSNAARMINNSYDGSTRDKCFPGSYIIKKGDRICQGIIAPVVQATFEDSQALTETERGVGGFGSTGGKG